MACWMPLLVLLAHRCSELSTIKLFAELSHISGPERFFVLGQPGVLCTPSN